MPAPDFPPSPQRFNHTETCARLQALVEGYLAQNPTFIDRSEAVAAMEFYGVISEAFKEFGDCDVPPTALMACLAQALLGYMKEFEVRLEQTRLERGWEPWGDMGWKSTNDNTNQ